MFADLLAAIQNLSTPEKQELFHFIEDSLTKNFVGKTDEIKQEIIESRFSEKIICPHCQSEKIVKNGHHQDGQRYQCRTCGKNFGNLTNSTIHSTKKPLEKWLAYARFMLNGLPIRRCAKELEISTKTAFRWRHKILNAVKNHLSNDIVLGIVETDETFFAESFKGNHKNDDFTMPRPPRKHGSKAGKRGISDEQICVVCSVDRKGGILSDMVCNGRVKTENLTNFFKWRICQNSTIVSDSHQSYRSLATVLDVSLIQIPEGKHVVNQIYHIQHVNSYHSRLKGWMRKFNGVATKYLPNYLYWFKWLELAKGNASEKAEKLVIESNNSLTGNLRWVDFKNITPQFM